VADLLDPLTEIEFRTTYLLQHPSASRHVRERELRGIAAAVERLRRESAAFSKRVAEIGAELSIRADD
jgi:uncharacterized protein (UPF0335 family)